MPKFRPPVSVRSLGLVFLLLLPFSIVRNSSAQATTQTPAQRQFDRIDFAISGAGEITNSVSGVEERDSTTTHSTLTIKPSTTVGELVTLRYTAKPYFGLEFNFGNARFTQNYTFSPQLNPPVLAGGSQAAAREMTFGYVAHPRARPFGLQPFLGLGGGTIRFKPTTYGGQGLPQQFRATYYYTLGVEGNFPDSHFGVRVGFRQLIYLAPDFLQNYLTITRRVRTSEPTIGFFVRF
jgi:hypothetical protein